MTLFGIIRLMIVDDHVLCCTGLAALFRTSRNINVAASTNEADEAVELAERGRPDVVLMDVALHDHSAFRTTVRILACCSQTRVVFMDDSVCHANVYKAVRVGGVGYWTKHATIEEITEAVHVASVGSLTFCPTVRPQVICDANGVHFDQAQGDGALGTLSRRETELMAHLANGRGVRECAQRMRLADNTVKNYKSRLMKKLDIHTAADLARLAVREGLVMG